MTFRHEPRRPESLWILVADRAAARIFSASSPEFKDFQEIKTLVHPEGAARAGEVLSDRPGRFAGMSGDCVSGDPETDHRHRTAADFAHQVIEELEQGRVNNRFGGVVVIAPALFLGTLRKYLPAPLEKLVCCEIGKELTHARTDVILEQVRDALTADEA